MTKYPFPISVSAAVSTGISVDAKNRRSDFRSVLLDNESERFLPFGRWIVERNDP